MTTALARRSGSLYGGHPFLRRRRPHGLVRMEGWRDRFKSVAGPKAPMSGAEKAKRGTRALARTAIISGAAYVAGYGQGRFGTKVLPIPFDLLAGVTCHVAGFALMDRNDRLASHLQAAGDGALAAHFAAAGRGRGKAVRAKKGEAPLIEGEYMAGGRPELTGTASLTDEELARLARVSAG
ncbi:MAG TPA: hypothetical protein VGF45_03605 [Polyangia bacterium]